MKYGEECARINDSLIHIEELWMSCPLHKGRTETNWAMSVHRQTFKEKDNHDPRSEHSLLVWPHFLWELRRLLVFIYYNPPHVHKYTALSAYSTFFADRTAFSFFRFRTECSQSLCVIVYKDSLATILLSTTLHNWIGDVQTVWVFSKADCCYNCLPWKCAFCASWHSAATIRWHGWSIHLNS